MVLLSVPTLSQKGLIVLVDLALTPSLTKFSLGNYKDREAVLKSKRIESSLYKRHWMPVNILKLRPQGLQISSDYFFSRVARRSTKSILTFAFVVYGINQELPAGKETIFQNDTVCSYISAYPLLPSKEHCSAHNSQHDRVRL